MPRLYRPSIPDSVKVAVALRQLHGFKASWAMTTRGDAETLRIFLHRLHMGLAIYLRCGFDELRLDHNPALGTRKRVRRAKRMRNGELRDILIYTPAANDAAHLIYRSVHDHHIKTNVRGDGAQYSDTVLMKRERRRKKAASKTGAKVRSRKQKPKQKIPQRKQPWPQGRKIPSRKR